MRKILCALALILGMLLSPALAAEEGSGRPYEGFTDVADTDWFAPYVEICTWQGLMNGTDGGNFSPDRPLTVQKCSVLALRLYDLNHGGDGIFEKAPEDFGQITITLENGDTYSGSINDNAVIQGLPWPDKTWSWSYVDTRFEYDLYLGLVVQTEEERNWFAERDILNCRATATYDGIEYPGEMWFFSHTGVEGYYHFCPDDHEAFATATTPVRFYAADTGTWYRDAWYSAYLHSAEDSYTMYSLIQGGGTATRWDFADRLAQVAGELPAINEVESIPLVDGWQETTLLPLYNGGILTRIDEYGSFYPEDTLTRAEAAAMLARVLEPELRISFTPEPPNYQDYTLTELDTAGYNPEPGTNPSSDYLLLSLQDMNDYHMDYAVLLPDGSIVYPPKGYRFTGYIIYGLVQLQDEVYTPISTVMDLYTGEIILPPAQYGTIWYPDSEHLITLAHTGASSPPLILRDRTGQQISILPQDVDAVWSEFREGVAVCQDESSGLYGYVDATGNWTLPPQWSCTDPFRDGAATVRNIEGKWGAIDHNGTFLIPCQYDLLRCSREGLYLSSNQDVSLWIPLDGEPFSDSHQIRPLNGYIANGWSYLDADYRPATPSLFDWTGPVGEDGSAFVGMDGKVYRITFHTPQSEP